MNREKVWVELFRKYDILNKVRANGFFSISTEQMKEFGEPRLLVSSDEYSGLPKIFKENKLSIIAVGRKQFLIGDFKLYKGVEIEEKMETKTYEPINLESLKISDLFNESSSILYAFHASMLQDAFDRNDLALTMYGKMGAGDFSFEVDSQSPNGGGEKHRIKVSRPQIEIDAGFESDEEVFIIEAKNRRVDEINLRQLYYPYRVWSSKVDKHIVPVFFIYTDSTFYIFKCEFMVPNNINSLVIVDKKKYVLADEPITMEDIIGIHKSSRPTMKIGVPFPQADKMEKILELLDLLDANELSTTLEDIAEHFQFDRRQADYYSNAAKFLGYSDKKRGHVILTERGKRLLEMKYKEKHLDILKSMFEDVVIHKAFKQVIENGTLPRQMVTEWLSNTYFRGGAPETPSRRSGTVVGWINWAIRISNDE